MERDERLEALERRLEARERELQAVRRQRPRVTPGTALLLLAVLALTALCGSRAYAVANVPNLSTPGLGGP